MCLGVPAHQGPARWQELVGYGKPMAERALPGFGTARAAKTRKKIFFFSPVQSQVCCDAPSGNLFATIAEPIPLLPSVGCRCRAGLRPQRLPLPLLLPALAGVAAMESPGRARPRLFTSPGASAPLGALQTAEHDAHSLFWHEQSRRWLRSAPLSAPEP